LPNGFFLKKTISTLLQRADLLDTRADLRQPVTGPARLSRRDVRVACTQV
jgi:hypothetical protein